MCLLLVCLPHTGTASSGGKKISVGRESTLATSISHPNVVQTYHISTMTAAQHSALANNWLAETSSGAAKPIGSSSPQQTLQQEGEDSSSDDNNSRSSIEAQQKNLLVSWLGTAASSGDGRIQFDRV